MTKISINISKGTIEKKDDVVVGIDLGTTNSLVAYSDDDGTPRILHRSGSAKLVPSVIYFDEHNNPKVGQEALKNMIHHPDRTIFSIKRLMGKSWNDIQDFNQFYAYDIIEKDEEELVRIRIDNKFFTPTELSGLILAELKQIAEEELKQAVTKAVITVPAYFNDSQRQATKDAGKLAGLDVLRIVNEPTAASLAFGLANQGEDKTIAVYDLGGGTFDLSILNLHDGIFEVLATHGDTFLGGDDFDKRIVDLWSPQLNQKSILYSDTALRLLAEKAKTALSQAEIFETQLNGMTLSISRTQFQKATADLIQRTIASCQKALDDASLSIQDMDEIILVGGSTRMPIVTSALETFFKKPVNNHVNPDEAVALGAAIQADILAGRRQDMLLLDVTPLSLGIETIGGLMDTILPRNSKIPAAVGRNYTTSIDGQKNLKVAVYQGERDLIEDNRKLGEFILNNIPPMAAGIPKIEIKFIIDADGILQVIAKELRSGVKQEIQIKPQYGITEEEMGRMLLESITNAESDIQKRALIEARTEGQSIVLSTNRFINQNESWLQSDQISELEQLKEQLEISLTEEDKDLILSAIENLNSYSAPLAHQALDRNIAAGLQGNKIE
jgi:molecular chaperone HscA